MNQEKDFTLVKKGWLFKKPALQRKICGMKQSSN
jgi:hypothetical protein